MYGVSQTSVHTSTLKASKARTVPFPPVQTWLWILARLQTKYFLQLHLGLVPLASLYYVLSPLLQTAKKLWLSTYSKENVKRLSEH